MLAEGFVDERRHKVHSRFWHAAVFYGPKKKKKNVITVTVFIIQLSLASRLC